MRITIGNALAEARALAKANQHRYVMFFIGADGKIFVRLQEEDGNPPLADGIPFAACQYWLGRVLFDSIYIKWFEDNIPDLLDRYKRLWRIRFRTTRKNILYTAGRCIADRGDI